MKWNHIVLEGFCTRKLSIKKDKYHYRLIDTKTLKTVKIDNKDYDPDYKTPKKPSYCKNRINQDCFFKNCPYLGIGEPPEKELKIIMRKICEIYDEIA